MTPEDYRASGCNVVQDCVCVKNRSFVGRCDEPPKGICDVVGEKTEDEPFVGGLNLNRGCLSDDVVVNY